MHVQTPPPDTVISLQEQQKTEWQVKPSTPEAFAFRERRPWVRFLARSLDYTLASAIFIITLFIAIVLGAGWLAQIPEIVYSIVVLFAWFFVEAAFLSVLGATPGKWLLRVKVRDALGAKLSYGSALGRGFDLFFRGEGLGIPIVTIITRLVAYSTLTNNGVTSWDASGNFVVTHEPVGWLRAIIGIGIVVGYVVVLMSFVVWAGQ